MELSVLQAERNEWIKKNFPGDAMFHSFLGCVEELGELSHHILKRDQGIRGDRAHHNEEIKDAIADLIIFAAGLATHEGFDLGEVVQETWDRVKQRDWKADPQRGGQ